LAGRAFNQIEDVTREFLRHPQMRELLGPPRHALAMALANTWVCREKKLLLRNGATDPEQ
jgi:hypothetical protein